MPLLQQKVGGVCTRAAANNKIRRRRQAGGAAPRGVLEKARARASSRSPRGRTKAAVRPRRDHARFGGRRAPCGWLPAQNNAQLPTAQPHVVECSRQHEDLERRTKAEVATQMQGWKTWVLQNLEKKACQLSVLEFEAVIKKYPWPSLHVAEAKGGWTHSVATTCDQAGSRSILGGKRFDSQSRACTCDGCDDHREPSQERAARLVPSGRESWLQRIRCSAAALRET